MANVPQPPTISAGTIKVDLGPLIKRAFELIKADLALFIVSFLIMFVLGLIPLVNIFIEGPLLIGFVRIIQKRLKGEPAAIGDIFKGFDDFGKGLITVLLLAVLSLVIVVPFTIIFVLAHYIPCFGTVLGPAVGIVLALAFCGAIYFVWPIVSLSDVAPFDSIRNSIRFAMANVTQMLILALVTCLIAWVGWLACGVGILFTYPLAATMAVIAYNEYYLPNAAK